MKVIPISIGSRKQNLGKCKTKLSTSNSYNYADSFQKMDSTAISFQGAKNSFQKRVQAEVAKRLKTELPKAIREELGKMAKLKKSKRLPKRSKVRAEEVFVPSADKTGVSEPRLESDRDYLSDLQAKDKARIARKNAEETSSTSSSDSGSSSDDRIYSWQLSGTGFP